LYVLAELSLQPLVERLEGASAEALYGLIFLASFAEGVLPPVPGDVAAAFFAFLSARAGGLWLPTTLAVTFGSVGGNGVVWWLGRRYGTRWLSKQMARFHVAKDAETAARNERRVEEAYRQYGWMGLFLSRFIPGFRAMAPAAAGAMGVPLWEMLLVLSAAAFIWYSVITWIAFKVGEDWLAVKAALTSFAQGAGIGATGLLAVLALVAWWLWRRRAKRRAAAAELAAQESDAPDQPSSSQ
jgi:membrane-associated protein